MKLKILIIPAVIVVILYLAIWVINPALKQLRQEKEDLAKEKAKLADIQEKNLKAESLSKSLVGQSEQRNILLKYIPEQKQEEEIIGNLNSLAVVSGLSVYTISIVEQKALAVPSDLETGSDSKTTEAAKPAVSEFQVKLGVIGGYEKIKDLLGKIASLQRFNSISNLKITKVKPQGEVDLATVDNLQAEATLVFNYLPKSNLIVNADNKIFSTGNFDLSVIDSIRTNLKTIMNSLSVGESGVSNPFVK